MVASPPSSRIMLGVWPPGQSIMRSVYSQYSSSVSPFLAKTETPAAAIAAAAWSWVEKMLHDDPADFGAERDQRLDQHGGLDGHVERAGNARALERLALRELLADRHQARHLDLGHADFDAAVVGERDVFDEIIGVGHARAPLKCRFGAGVIEGERPTGNGDIKKSLCLDAERRPAVRRSQGTRLRRSAERQHEIVDERGLAASSSASRSSRKRSAKLAFQSEIGRKRRPGWPADGRGRSRCRRTSAFMVVDVKVMRPLRRRRQAFDQVELGLVRIVGPEAVARRLEAQGSHAAQPRGRRPER